MNYNTEDVAEQIINIKESEHFKHGRCPACKAVITYRGENTISCICCGTNITWGIEEKED